MCIQVFGSVKDSFLCLDIILDNMTIAEQALEVLERREWDKNYKFEVVDDNCVYVDVTDINHTGTVFDLYTSDIGFLKSAGLELRGFKSIIDEEGFVEGVELYFGKTL